MTLVRYFWSRTGDACGEDADEANGALGQGGTNGVGGLVLVELQGRVVRLLLSWDVGDEGGAHVGCGDGVVGECEPAHLSQLCIQPRACGDLGRCRSQCGAGNGGNEVEPCDSLLHEANHGLPLFLLASTWRRGLGG